VIRPTINFFKLLAINVGIVNIKQKVRRLDNIQFIKVILPSLEV
jgi:hypothetical protein